MTPDQWKKRLEEIDFYTTTKVHHNYPAIDGAVVDMRITLEEKAKQAITALVVELLEGLKKESVITLDTSKNSVLLDVPVGKFVSVEAIDELIKELQGVLTKEGE